MADYKRYDGYVMNIPQKMIDSKLPVCPFCGTNTPHWLLKSKMEMSLAGSRTYYRCEQCEATMSSTAADAAADGGKNFRINPAMAAMSAAEKGTKRQEVGVTYLRVEELGRVCTEQALLHQEFPITYFQQRIGTVPAAAPTAPVAPAPVAAPVQTPPVQPIGYDTQTGAPIYAPAPAPAPVAAPASVQAPPAQPIVGYDPQTGAPIYAPASTEAIPKDNPVLSKLFMFLFIFAAANAGRTLFGMTVGSAITNLLYNSMGYDNASTIGYVFSIFGVFIFTAIAVVSCIFLMKASKQTDEPMKQKMWFIGSIVSLAAQGISALYSLITYIIALADGYPSFFNGFTVLLALMAPAATLLCAVTFINHKDKTVKILAIVTLATIGTNLLFGLFGLPYWVDSVFGLFAVSATAVFYFFVSKSYRKQ